MPLLHNEQIQALGQVNTMAVKVITYGVCSIILQPLNDGMIAIICLTPDGVGIVNALLDNTCINFNCHISWNHRLQASTLVVTGNHSR